MKVPTLYRSLPRALNVPYSLRSALMAGLARGRRDALLYDARRSTCPHERKWRADLARLEHRDFLTRLREARLDHASEESTLRWTVLREHHERTRAAL